MRTSLVGALSISLATCAAPPLSLGDATARAARDGRLVAVAVLPQCCRPCGLDARAQLAQPTLSAWLELRAWQVEYDPVRDAPGLACWQEGALAGLTLARADGGEVAWSSWDEQPDERLARFEAIVGGDDSRAVRRLDAYARGEDPSARQDRARAWAEHGEPARALEEYLWCFDHGLEVDPAYRGVRLSYLLGDLERLAASHPPAAEALEQRMARAETAIASEPGNFGAWQELTSIARGRGAGERVLACVERLDHRRPLRVKIRLWLLEEWLPLLLSTGRPAEVLWLCAGEPLEVTAHWTATFEAEASQLERCFGATSETEDTEGMFGLTLREFRGTLARRRLSVASRVAGLYSAELALAHERSARALLERALAFAPAPEVYLQLARHAESLGRVELATGILHEGLAELPASETGALASALRRLEPGAR